MTNFEAFGRFGEAHGTKIDKLFWIAGSIKNNDLKDLLDSITEKEYKNLFPDIFESKDLKSYFKDCLYADDTIQALIDLWKFGLIAKIHIPKCDNFVYKDDKPVSWSVHDGISRIAYVYAETLEELINEIEKKSKEVFQQYVNRDLKNK